MNTRLLLQSSLAVLRLLALHYSLTSHNGPERKKHRILRLPPRVQVFFLILLHVDASSNLTFQLAELPQYSFAITPAFETKSQ
jgi:hypothetical protein